MSLSKELAQAHETATKLFGGYSDTNYQDGDSDDVLAAKRVLAEKKREYIDQKTKKLVTETIMELAYVANGQGNDVLSDAMVDGLHLTHREIQRMFIQEHLIPALAKYADANDIKFTDGRNEGIKKVVGEMIEPFRYLIR